VPIHDDDDDDDDDDDETITPNATLRADYSEILIIMYQHPKRYLFSVSISAFCPLL